MKIKRVEVGNIELQETYKMFTLPELSISPIVKDFMLARIHLKNGKIKEGGEYYLRDDVEGIETGISNICNLPKSKVRKWAIKNIKYIEIIQPFLKKLIIFYIVKVNNEIKWEMEIYNTSHIKEINIKIIYRKNKKRG